MDTIKYVCGCLVDFSSNKHSPLDVFPQRFYNKCDGCFTMNATDIKTKGPVDEITVKIIAKDETREVRGGSLKVCECTCEDSSGKIVVSFWNDDIARFEVGDTIKITKGWANEYQGKITVSSGKFGKIEKV